MFNNEKNQNIYRDKQIIMRIVLFLIFIMAPLTLSGCGYVSFDNSDENTINLSVIGKGYFIVWALEENEAYFTRSSSFSLNQENLLVNPQGYVLQGWALDEDGNLMGAIKDIAINTGSYAPNPTSEIDIAANLDSASGIIETGISAGGYTQSTDPTESKFLLLVGKNEVIDVGGTTVDLVADTLLLSSGNYYSGDEIAAGIIDAMANQGFTVDARYEEATGTFVIENNDGGPITINWDASNAAGVLGFDPVAESIADGATTTSDSSVAFNIVAGQNDTMSITVDGNPITQQEVVVSIVAGSYTGDSLANELERAINDQLLSDGEPGSVVVSYEVADGFIIESSTLGVDGSIQINAIAGQYALVEEVLGIDDFTVNNGSGFQVEEPDDTSNYSTSLPVYDSLGNQHNVTIYFRKAVETDSSAIWEWFAYVPGGDTVSGEPEVQARGTLSFNNSGVLINQSGTTWLTDSGGFDFVHVDPGQVVEIDFGFIRGTNIITQFRMPSSIIYQTQDGYGSGFLQELVVDLDGVISVKLTNGPILFASQIALAIFEYPENLQDEGNGLYSETEESGTLTTNIPGIITCGEMATGIIISYTF